MYHAGETCRCRQYGVGQLRAAICAWVAREPAPHRRRTPAVCPVLIPQCGNIEVSWCANASMRKRRQPCRNLARVGSTVDRIALTYAPRDLLAHRYNHAFSFMFLVFRAQTALDQSWRALRAIMRIHGDTAQPTVGRHVWFFLFAAALESSSRLRLLTSRA